MKTNFDNFDILLAETNERKNRSTRLIANAKASLALAKSNLKAFTENTSGLPEYLFEQELAKSKSVVSLIEHRIVVLEDEYKLIRPSFDNDIRYRKKLLDIFAQEVKKLGIGKDKLRFHGAPLVPALQTIESGEISPSSDRGLGQTSLDINGQISVTDYSSVQLSLQDYTGIKDHFLPMGCIFVVTPQDADDERSIQSYTMRSLKIFDNGQPSTRLKYILASPESLPILKGQLKKFGYPENLAIDYLDFLIYIASL